MARTAELQSGLEMRMTRYSHPRFASRWLDALLQASPRWTLSKAEREAKACSIYVANAVRNLYPRAPSASSPSFVHASPSHKRARRVALLPSLLSGQHPSAPSPAPTDSLLYPNLTPQLLPIGRLLTHPPESPSLPPQQLAGRVKFRDIALVEHEDFVVVYSDRERGVSTTRRGWGGEREGTHRRRWKVGGRW